MTFQKGHTITNTGRTHWKKGAIPWNKGRTYRSNKRKTGKTISCLVCGENKYFEPNQLKRRPCLYCSIQCAKFAERKAILMYSSIHSRIKIDWGKANHCEEADIECSQVFDWANISDNYLLQRNDWRQLCRKHHIRFDKKKHSPSFIGLRK